jgi:hypothetical protein
LDIVKEQLAGVLCTQADLVQLATPVESRSLGSLHRNKADACKKSAEVNHTRTDRYNNNDGGTSDNNNNNNDNNDNNNNNNIIIIIINDNDNDDDNVTPLEPGAFVSVLHTTITTSASCPLLINVFCPFSVRVFPSALILAVVRMFCTREKFSILTDCALPCYTPPASRCQLLAPTWQSQLRARPSQFSVTTCTYLGVLINSPRTIPGSQRWHCSSVPYL